MTNVIAAAGGKAEFWLGLGIAAFGGALLFILGLWLVPNILHAFGA
jgi:hypothetical protein